jgi:hypothetical protein
MGGREGPQSHREPLELITVASSGNVHDHQRRRLADRAAPGTSGGRGYFPNSQAPRVNRPYEVFEIKLP